MLKDYLNPYTFALLIAYISATFAMQYNTTGFSLQGFVFISPIIMGMIIFSGRHVQEKRQDHAFRLHEKLFERDAFIISYSFLFAALISIMTQYDNSDVRGWWGIALYFYTIIGFIFSLFFAYFNQFTRCHNIYTNMFAALIIAMLALPNVWPRYIKLIFFGTLDFFWITLFCMGFLHLFLFLVHKACKKGFKGK